MRAHELAARLAGFEQRGPGSDAERRAAMWLARELQDSGREVRLDPFWCRPNWPLAHAWHVALALAGSLVSVSAPRVGAGLLLAALVSIILDAQLGYSPGRRLTPERASQNVVALPPSQAGQPPVRLVVTANYDAGRTGLVYRQALRGAAAALRRATGGVGPGWLGWLCLAITWLIAIAVLRYEGHHSAVVGIAQLVPTTLLVVLLAALLELATAGFGPAANDDATGTAVAMALVRALDAAPPRHLTVELVLQGAGEAGGLGMRRHLRRRAAPETAAPRGASRDRGRAPRWRRRRRELDPANAAVIALAPSGGGDLRWWTSDGPLLPLRYSRRLRQLCASVGPESQAEPHRGRGATPAFPARLARVPAIALGCLDHRGLVPRSHQPDDLPDEVDPAALDGVLEFGLILVDALDAFLAHSGPQAHASPPPARPGAASRA